MRMENRIQEWRVRRGLSQEKLAELLGTSDQQVSRLESGQRRLTTGWMERLATALGCEPAQLMRSSAPAAPAGQEKDFQKKIKDAILLEIWSDLTEIEQVYALRMIKGLLNADDRSEVA